jgi:hypothetical protein
MTFSIMTLCLATFPKMAFNIMTICITTLGMQYYAKWYSAQ